MQYVHFRLHSNYGRFLKKLADNQCSSMTKDSIFHIKHISIQPFTMGVDWAEIGCLIEVSIMFDICTYCVITFCVGPFGHMFFKRFIFIYNLHNAEWLQLAYQGGYARWHKSARIITLFTLWSFPYPDSNLDRDDHAIILLSQHIS